MTAMSIDQFIDNEVKANEVVLFMKGTPQFPMCGFSGQVVQILDYLGVPYKGLNVLENHSAALRQGRVRRRLRHHPRDVPGWRTAIFDERQGRPGEGRRAGLSPTLTRRYWRWLWQAHFSIESRRYINRSFPRKRELGSFRVDKEMPPGFPLARE